MSCSWRFMIAFLALIIIPCEGGCAPEKSTKISVTVLDEEGRTIEGSIVTGAFEQYSWEVKIIGDEEVTDNNGRATVSQKSNGHVVVTASKEGYYVTRKTIDFFEKRGFKWHPWNPEVELILRKIENPVPMYARDIDMIDFIIPVEGKWVGLDLETLTWCSPYGDGKSPDFLFKSEINITDESHYDMKLNLRFANEHDGILELHEDISEGSDFPLLRFAPKDGYLEKYSFFAIREGESLKRNFDKNTHFIFRVRSYEEDGQIKGMHGKVHGGLSFAVDRHGKVHLDFRYYLNPDYTRNLEFDESRNLTGKWMKMK